MEKTMRTCCQIPIKKTSWNVFGRVQHMLRHAVTVIVSAREAQARRRIQLYFDERLIDEIRKKGEKLAINDIND